MNTTLNAADELGRVLAHVDTRRDEYVTRVMDYVRHPSISAQDIGMSSRMAPTCAMPMSCALMLGWRT